MQQNRNIQWYYVIACDASLEEKIRNDSNGGGEGLLNRDAEVLSLLKRKNKIVEAIPKWKYET